METFGSKLLAITAERGRLCVGIDPHPSLLNSWNLPVSAEGVAAFSRICVEAFGDTVAVVKPQVAFFEAYGSRGYAILEETMGALREKGALVLADAKRGDIGSTMAAYAMAWLHPESSLVCDAVTVSPYLGVGALSPAFELAQSHGKGVYVLAATSNPEGVTIQSNGNDAGTSVAQQVVDEVASLNAIHGNAGVPGNFGVVVGATLESAPSLSKLNGSVLLPGVGAQGGTAADVARLAAGVEALAIPNISRGVLKAGPDVAALREAAQSAAQDFPGLINP
ncbi:orotidine 5'-phosphate decarboxylase [Corynebacterium kalinowskii]|uniref:Orotidine 5'-phosphate decarboxylase n=1 Tax=Corynebacterium kalinowskii TaxID=2675216 RepID=A0A6B8VXS2_9CORY|nr:orotidine-5'-phosphate decarboxylase [Corynebacterium kalinowskii]QGU02100.1 orotidine 5'-phosphate decarboxylase [Corynebacterium kalinowskii]